jgi:adenylate cyclase
MTMSNITTPRVRFPLWLKFALLSSLLVTLPVVIIGYRAINRGSTQILKHIRQYHEAMLGDVCYITQQNIKQAEQALRQFSRVLSDPELPIDGKIPLLRFILDSSNIVDFVSVYTPAGERIDVFNKATLSPPEQQLDPELMKAAKENGPALGNALIFASSVRVEMLHPIKTKEGELTGYVQTLFPLSDIQHRVETLNEIHDKWVEQEEEYYVLDQKSRRLVDPDMERSLSLEVFDVGVQLKNDIPQEQKERYFSRSERTDEEGNVLFRTAQFIPNTPWIAAIETPKKNAFKSVIMLQWEVWTTAALSLLASILGSALLATGITRPIKTLVSFAKELSARNFSARVNITSRDELSILGGAMSQAAAELESSEAALKKEVEIRTDLGRYMPKEVVERVVRREQNMALGGEKRQISVLFADVVGFTPLSEKLSPEDSVAILNHLFTVLTEIVFRHQGTVDKFIGDCLMAFFGAPTAQEDHAAKAVAAAEDMIRWLEIGNASWKKRYGITIQLAIGVNTGDAVVGNVGSETRMEYTAIGDVVNVAARLESVARPQQILISKETMLAAGDQFEFLPMGEKSLVGREKMVETFEVVI